MQQVPELELDEHTTRRFLYENAEHVFKLG